MSWAATARLSFQPPNDYHQSSARTLFDGTRSLTAFEMTSRSCHFDEHGEEKSPDFQQDTIQKKSAEFGW
jgi:hypothetical protein